MATPSTPTEPTVLVDTGGLVVTDDGRKVVLLNRATGRLANILVVLVAATVALLGFGLWGLLGGELDGRWSWALLAGAVVAAGLTVKAIGVYRARRAAPLRERRTVAVLDRKLNLFSYSGGAITALDQVSFTRRPQLISTTTKLVAHTPGGRKVLMRGYRLDGGIGHTDELLNGVARGESA